MQGREIRQSVRWDRIPLYCQECKHVGHSSDVCYANGNREKPMKRNYKFAADEGLRQGNSGGVDGKGVDCMENDLGSVLLNRHQVGAEGLSAVDGKGDGRVQDGMQEQDDGGFQLQGKRRGKQGKGAWDVSGLKGGSPGERGQGALGGSDGEGRAESPLRASENRFSILRSAPEFSLGSLAMECGSQPRYLKMLPNGDFDPEVYEDEKEWEDEDELGSDSKMQQVRLVDKRGATLVVEKNMEENVMKKGRLIDGVSSEMV